MASEQGFFFFYNRYRRCLISVANKIVFLHYLSIAWAIEKG
jgi:hypothetical protein